MILNGEFEEALAVARQQVENGAQIIDINMDEAMLDSTGGDGALPQPDRRRARDRARADHDRQLQVEVIEAGLKCIQGKGIVNSHLAEGRRGRVPPPGQAGAPLRRRRGGDGLRRDRARPTPTQRKIEICERAYRILVDEVGFPPEDIIFDPNIFAIATGIEEHDNYAVDFIEATRWIKQHLPGAKVSAAASAT